MQNYPIARPSPAAAPAGTATCAICQVPVDLVERPVAHLAGAVFAHESCALSFARTSPNVGRHNPRSLSRF